MAFAITSSSRRTTWGRLATEPGEEEAVHREAGEDEQRQGRPDRRCARPAGRPRPPAASGRRLATSRTCRRAPAVEQHAGERPDQRVGQHQRPRRPRQRPLRRGVLRGEEEEGGERHLEGAVAAWETSRVANSRRKSRPPEDRSAGRRRRARLRLRGPAPDARGQASPARSRRPVRRSGRCECGSARTSSGGQRSTVAADELLDVRRGPCRRRTARAGTS